MSTVGGFRCNTRHKLGKGIREKGKVSLTRYFQSFSTGDKVKLQAEPAIQNGMYHPRFHSRPGEVIGKRGRCYEVRLKDGSVVKTLIVHPIHLLRQA
ncbi:50S ribosomal protein L21e [Candidatus Woesearchaeota archaeon]|nr:50S ribosomal protein L21e [Candidatus Woesearchaeota archaeon]